MVFSRFLYPLVIFWIMLFASQKVFSQLSRSEIIGAYIYNFAKNTKFEKETKLNTYNITLVTENVDLINEFKKIETKLKIHNKPINVNFKKKSDFNFSDIYIIFIAKDKSNLVSEIFTNTEKENILIVSENYLNKKKIMINLYDTNEGKILFEVNKENIYKRKIKISDDLILMGGTVVDVFKLYEKSQEQLKKAEQDYKILQAKIKNIKKQYAEIQKNTIIKEEKLKEQIKIIEKQKQEYKKLLHAIKTTKNEFKKYQSEIETQKNMLNEEKNKLKLFSDSLRITKALLKKQKKGFAENMEKLYFLEDEIRKRNKEVKIQETTLGEQYEKINKQKKVNYLISTILVLGFFLFIAVLVGLIYRKKKNNLLKEQKEELKQKNETIADHLEKKKLINNLLKDKNNELSSTIYELKKTQQQLIQSEKMASLGILTAGIAHEINNPINFVYTGVNSLQKDFDDIEVVIKKVNQLKSDDNDLKEKIIQIEKLKEKYYFEEAVKAIPEIISGIKEGATRTAEIVDGLRTFARMDENKLISINLNESIDASLLILKNKYKNIIDIVRNYDNIPNVKCNPGKISQVIVNILVNAIDALLDAENKKNNKKIVITTSFENTFVTISIKDNGTGIPANIKDKIFDPFFTTKEIGKGTGLGLSISYNIIKEHNGNIEIKTKTGIGTEFIIKLPIN